MNKGVFYALGAYVLWGLLPIFWKLLQHVPAQEILAHRMVWALGFVLMLLAYRRHWRWLGPVFRNKHALITFTSAALLLSLNWFVYIWAVTAGYIVETSLGYFINPLVSVLLGVIVLGERLRLWQGIAVGVALAGVLYLTYSYGALPWIALTLAGCFGLYGLLRKTAPLGALEGLTLETILFFPPALAYLLYLQLAGTAAFGQVSAGTTLLLIGTGLVTAGPLLLFATGARMIPMTLLGILQYAAPTIQLLLGTLVYGEPFNTERMIGFSLIWLALAIYTIEGLLRNHGGAHRRMTPEAGAIAGSEGTK